jgi:hypothetical protein
MVGDSAMLDVLRLSSARYSISHKIYGVRRAGETSKVHAVP